MRTFSQTDTPIGLAILVALLTWIASQLYAEVRDSLIATDGMVAREENGQRVVVYHLTNESLTRSIVPLSFSLRCPNSIPCFTKALAANTRYAQPESVAPWTLPVTVAGDDVMVSATVNALPPGGTVQVVASLPEKAVFPAFSFIVDSSDTGVPTILPASNPLVFVARHYFELLVIALVTMLALVGWWMFSTETRNAQSS